MYFVLLHTFPKQRERDFMLNHVTSYMYLSPSQETVLVSSGCLWLLTVIFGLKLDYCLFFFISGFGLFVCIVSHVVMSRSLDNFTVRVLIIVGCRVVDNIHVIWTSCHICTTTLTFYISSNVLIV